MIIQIFTLVVDTKFKKKGFKIQGVVFYFHKHSPSGVSGPLGCRRNSNWASRFTTLVLLPVAEPRAKHPNNTTKILITEVQTLGGQLADWETRTRCIFTSSRRNRKEDESLSWLRVLMLDGLDHGRPRAYIGQPPPSTCREPQDPNYTGAGPLRLLRRKCVLRDILRWTWIQWIRQNRAWTLSRIYRYVSKHLEPKRHTGRSELIQTRDGRRASERHWTRTHQMTVIRLFVNSIDELNYRLLFSFCVEFKFKVNQSSCEKKTTLWKKKFSYDFKTRNDIISHVLWKKRHYFLWKQFKTKNNTFNEVFCNRIFLYYRFLQNF